MISDKRRRSLHHWQGKLTDQEVELIRKLVEGGQFTQKEIAEKFELAKSTVSMIVNYQRR